MRPSLKKLSLILLLLMTVVPGTAGATGGAADPPLLAKDPYAWWRAERARRQAAIDAYVARHPAEFRSFRTQPLGIKQSVLNFVGVPMIMFRLFPELFPDIWGPPQRKMAKVGFGPDPWEPSSVMPLGTGYIPSVGFKLPNRDGKVSVNYATLSCMGCHSGAYSDASGTLRRTIGGPTQLGNFFGFIYETVTDDRYKPETFRRALRSKPLGWVYGKPSMLKQEALERALFLAPGGAEFFLEEVRFASVEGHDRIVETLDVYTYNIPDAPPLTTMPGQLDVFSLAAAGFADPSTLTPAQLEAALPAAPAPADIPAAWAIDERHRYQWDNAIGNLDYREVAASLTVVSHDAAAVNLDNVQKSAVFVQGLPPAPYPFDVDSRRAARGKLLFEQACAGCHKPGGRVLETPARVGTDPNRAEVYTDYLKTSFIAEMRAACTVPACYTADGKPLPDSDILLETGRYAATPLAGIWATAPYLHNGSVPTLYHLLAGGRPTTFYRANTTYNQDLVGFTYRYPSNLRATLYDTRQAGHSNLGHAGARYNGGIDWRREPGKLKDLLEYLKTL
ncbi:MAG: hypothetical protein U1E14_17415 [Geminicoccaceae bacterium]